MNLQTMASNIFCKLPFPHLSHQKHKADINNVVIGPNVSVTSLGSFRDRAQSPLFGESSRTPSLDVYAFFCRHFLSIHSSMRCPLKAVKMRASKTSFIPMIVELTNP